MSRIFTFATVGKCSGGQFPPVLLAEHPTLLFVVASHVYKDDARPICVTGESAFLRNLLSEQALRPPYAGRAGNTSRPSSVPSGPESRCSVPVLLEGSPPQLLLPPPRN